MPIEPRRNDGHPPPLRPGPVNRRLRLVNPDETPADEDTTGGAPDPEELKQHLHIQQMYANNYFKISRR